MGRTAGRRLLGAACLCALIAAVALVGDDARASSGCTGGSLYIVAHADDSIIFQNPDLQRDISAGRCVRTVIVTAGDDGDTSAYWLQREAGVEAAYAEMAGVADAWTQADAGVSGHPDSTRHADRTAERLDRIHGLADGNVDGSGFAAYGSQSLQKLWQGTIGSISADDGSSSYTKTTLTATLAGLMTSARPDRVLTQDYLGLYGDGDHSDHHTVAYLVQAASQQYAAPHLLNGYRGYPISSLPANLDAATTQAKEATWFAYAAYDAKTCHTVSSCQGTYAPWWQREYTRGLQFSGLSPATGAPGTTITLSGAGFTNASAVSFNGVAAQFTVVSDSTIAAVVPSAATTGVVTVTTQDLPASGPSQFTVTAPSGADRVLDATATASSENVANQEFATKAVDGHTDGCCTGDPTHEWRPPPAAASAPGSISRGRARTCSRRSPCTTGRTRRTR